MIERDLDKFRELTETLIRLEKEDPVAQPISTEKLYDTLNLQLNDEGMNEEEFYKGLEKIVKSTPRTASNQFFNQLFGGRKSKAMLGDLLAVVLNNSMYTYKVAGPMVGVEKEIIRRVADLVGYSPNAGGTIATGGSMCNFMAMVMARDAFQSEVRFKGVQDKMIAYTSVDCHYSIAKNASLIGIGRDQVRFIPTDERGIMISSALEEQIAEDKAKGLHPFFINVTAGTTVMGAFDHVEETADIAKRHQLWLHVDGAYCGGVIFSKKFNHLVEGAHKADSFSVNAHKMLGTPLTCSILLSKDKKHLSHSFASDAKYLYQTDDDEFNLGKTSFQCGRRNDALKFWTLWKYLGTKGLEHLIDHQFYLAEVAREYINSNKNYQLYSYEDSISICFNYKDVDPIKLCTLLYEKAALMVGYGSFRNDTFVRFVTINADNTKEDIINFFKTLEQFVEDHVDELLTPELAD